MFVLRLSLLEREREIEREMWINYKDISLTFETEEDIVSFVLSLLFVSSNLSMLFNLLWTGKVVPKFIYKRDQCNLLQITCIPIWLFINSFFVTILDDIKFLHQWNNNKTPICWVETKVIFIWCTAAGDMKFHDNKSLSLIHTHTH